MINIQIQCPLVSTGCTELIDGIKKNTGVILEKKDVNNDLSFSWIENEPVSSSVETYLKLSNYLCELKAKEKIIDYSMQILDITFTDDELKAVEEMLPKFLLDYYKSPLVVLWTLMESKGVRYVKDLVCGGGE